MPLKDLLHPTAADLKTTHKLKRLVQSPNSYFIDIRCNQCITITTVFSHAQTVVSCAGCSNILATPTGGLAKLAPGTSFRRKDA